MSRLHIKAGPTLRGQTQFVTLNMTLSNNGTSDESWDEAVLKSNPEVMNFHSKGKIVFVTEAQRAAELKAVAAAVEAEKLDAALDPDTITDISDALETDNPSVAEARKLAHDIKLSLNKLEALLSGNTGAKRVQSSPKAPAPKEPEADASKGDGLDLPMSPPIGLKPSVTTEAYLRKTPAEKRKWLKECLDIGLLRDAALHEPDAKMKVVARKAAKSAEKSAEEATKMAEASA